MSRPATHPFGACDAEIKAMVPEAIKDELAFVACSYGLSTSEYLRDFIISHLRGRVSVIRMTVQRASGMAITGRIPGADEGAAR